MKITFQILHNSCHQLSSAVISCQQLLTADDSCHEKNLNGIFIHILKVICVPNFSSLDWFSLSSAVNSSLLLLWLLTIDNSCYENSFNGIFIYILKVISVPNFNSLGWFSLSSAVNSFWQLVTIKINLESWNLEHM